MFPSLSNAFRSRRRNVHCVERCPAILEDWGIIQFNYYCYIESKKMNRKYGIFHSGENELENF